MKKHLSVLSIALVALLSVFIIVSCSQDVAPSDVIDVSNTFSMGLKSGSDLTVSATYKTDYFSSDSSAFSKDMALLSFVGASSMNKADSIAFYETMGFSNPMPMGWDAEPTADSVAYTIAVKRTGNFEIVGITVRGFNYESEWANNVTIGSTGDHEGFTMEAEKILASLKLYLKLYVSDPSNIKVWIMGYSRGGGISGLLAHKVLDAGIVKEKDMYAYTFEAPSQLGSADTFNCIHNVRNSADLIPYVPFEDWGFHHAGVETDIYNENIRTYLMEDLGLAEEDFPVFNPSSEHPTPAKFAEYLTGLVRAVDVFSTRSKFVETSQNPLREFIPMLVSDRHKGLNALEDYFSSMEIQDIFNFLGNCMDDDEYAYKEFDQVFYAAGVKYEKSELEDVSKFITTLVSDNGHLLALLMAAYLNLDNSKYLVLSHYPEVTYVALKHFTL